MSGDVTGPSNGDRESWLIKLDASGNKIWDRLYGGSGYDAPYTLLATADGGLLMASYSSSPVSGDVSQAGPGTWLVKLDALGTKQWDRIYADSLIGGVTDIKLLPNGGYALGCQAVDATNPNSSRADDFGVMNISSTGVLRWRQIAGGDSNELLNNLVALPNGDLLVAGTSVSNISRDKTANCRGAADIWILKVSSGTALSTTGQLTNVGVNLYPNPTSSQSVSLALSGLREQAHVRVECINAIGQVVYTTHLAVQRGNVQQEMTLPDLPSGLYMLRVYANEGIITKQLLKK